LVGTFHEAEAHRYWDGSKRDMGEFFGMAEPFDVGFYEEVFMVIAWENKRLDMTQRFDKGKGRIGILFKVEGLRVSDSSLEGLESKFGK